MTDSPPSTQLTPSAPTVAASDHTPESFGRAMPRWEMHFRFWLWTCFTLGGGYVLYAFQEAIQNASSASNGRAYLFWYMFQIFLMFLIISNFALESDKQLKELHKPIVLPANPIKRKMSWLALVLAVLVPLGAVIYLWLKYSTTPTSSGPTLPPSLSPQWLAALESLATNPLIVILPCAAYIRMHARKLRQRLATLKPD